MYSKAAARYRFAAGKRRHAEALPRRRAGVVIGCSHFSLLHDGVAFPRCTGIPRKPARVAMKRSIQYQAGAPRLLASTRMPLLK